jgi:hypothetical protein
LHTRTFEWTNDTGEFACLVYEPDGRPFDIESGASVRVVCSGIESGELEVVRDDDGFVAFGWPSARAQIWVDDVMIYASPIPMPGIPPGLSTRTFMGRLFGRAS